MNGRKGTEKPIEIFVALFVILAVALVMLKLFQNQITQKQQELQVQQESTQQLAERATLSCKDRCNAAGNDGCSLQALANFCITYGSDAIKAPDFLDYNGDQKSGYDDTKLVGVGLCEDAVPCHALVSSCCGQQMSGSGCKGILEQYWRSQGFSTQEISCLVQKNVRKGTCTVTAAQQPSFWFNRAQFDTLILPGVTCS